MQKLRKKMTICQTHLSIGIVVDMLMVIALGLVGI